MADAPAPTASENLKDYIVRCMADQAMTEEYGDVHARYSQCLNTYNEAKPHHVQTDPEEANTP